MSQRYLVALDNSPRAEHVLAAAVGLARRANAKLVLFRAVGIPIELPVEAYAMSPDAVAELLRAEGQRELEKLAEKVPKETLQAAKVITGTPWHSICQAAHDEDADLVILGSHGYGGLDRLLGTTAAKVVNHCEVSVLVVRAAERLQR